MNSPNVLFLVWDSCRYDTAIEHAPTLRSLGESNLWFENAIAPASWSLPSHASLFTGDLAHEHGCYRLNDSLGSNPLVSSLLDQGYSTYGVSANGFACHRMGLDEAFDEFYYSGGEEPFLDGIGVYASVFQALNEDTPPSKIGLTSRLLTEALTDDSPLKSLMNLGMVGLGRVAGKSTLIQQLPHPVFASYHGYSYSPKQNTNLIKDILAKKSNDDDPFFLFANYMDPHRPYVPPDDLQKKHVGRNLSQSELRYLNDEVAAPWEFIQRVENDRVLEEDLETLRNLYNGEVESVDRHLQMILNALDQYGLREDTLVVVTADHGENLGEVDEMDRRRFGHEASVSDNLLRVPLVIAHPDLQSRNVSDLISLKDLYDLFIDGHETVIETGGSDISPLLPEGDTVLSEYPAVGGKEIFDRFPNISRETLDQRVFDHTVVAYDKAWKVAIDSNSERWAWNDGSAKDFNDAPESLVSNALRALEQLHPSDTSKELSSEEQAQLEALGYL